MKKIVALVLSLVMVLGLATTAFGAATKEWDKKYFVDTSDKNATVAEYSLEYFAPVALKYDTETGLVTNGDAACIAYYTVNNWSETYVEVGSLGEADLVVYNDKVDGKAVGLFKYLKEVDNVQYFGNGVAFNDFGKACGQFKLVPETDAKYYSFEKKVYKAEVSSTTALMVDGKLVPVSEVTAGSFVKHVASYTYNDKFEVTAVKCSECGAAATIVPNYASLPAAVAAGAVMINDGQYFYFPAVAAPAVDAETDKVESAETFDAGIAMYVGMSVMAAAGSAVVLKKKD